MSSERCQTGACEGAWDNVMEGWFPDDDGCGVGREAPDRIVTVCEMRSRPVVDAEYGNLDCQSTEAHALHL